MKSLFNLLLICLMGVAIFGCKQENVPDRIVKIISVKQIQYENSGGFLGSPTYNKWSVRSVDVNTNEKLIFLTYDSKFSVIQTGEIVTIYWKDGYCAGYCLKEIK